MKCSTIVCTSLVIAILMCAGQASAAIDPESILGIWLLDEGLGDTTKDASGNGHDGTLVGSPEWVGGQFGNALTFNGSSTYVNCGSPAAFNTELFSVSFWCNIPSTQGWNHMISRGQHVASGTPGSVNWGVMMYESQQTILYEIFNDTAWTGINTATTTGEWHHVVATYDGSTMQLYHDGALGASASGVGNLLDETRWFLIGARSDAGAAGGFFNGSLDEVGYFNAVLSVEDIELIMNNGLAIVVGGSTEATDPQPTNGQTDVPRDGMLSWTPGMFAQTHDVYLGTNVDDVAAASTSDPRDVLVGQGLTEASVDHGRLEFEQTYYWRVDEVNGAPDHSIYKGDIWSFIVEPFAYTIEGVIATSNTASEAGQGPNRLVDSSGLNASGQHSNRTVDMWAGTPNPNEPSYVQFELDGVYKLHEMLVWNYNFEFEFFLGFGVKDATVAYSADGVDWTVLSDVQLTQAPGTSTYAAPTVIPLEGVAAQYVRLTINSAWSAMASQYGLSEVRFMYIPAYPREPKPADGATGLAVDTTLAWRSGRGAGTHEVYLGTDPAALDLAGTTTQSSYSPDLNLDTTYYWQIVEVNEAEAISTWIGDIWSFSTQEYVLIEGFEAYNDDIEAGTTIWQGWVDGLDDPTNGGAVVGYGQSPFAEQSIVRTGRQSMPFFFENDSASAFAEADHTLSPGQNWTVDGIKTLSLWFYGAEGNTGQLYVKINGVKVLYEGDTSDIAKAVWQPWNIDLTTVGNVSNVTMLSFGVQGAGSGVVYVDDVRLYAKAAEVITPVDPGAANLVGSWAFDGNVNDGSGNGHNGTLVGSGITFGSDPVRGQVLSLPGGDDIYVSIGAVGISGTMPRTIGCWAKADNTSIPDWTLIFGFTGTASGEGGNGSHFNIGSLGGPGGVGAHCWGWEETIFSDTEALEWHHYAMSYNGTTIRYYGDGVPMDTDPAKSNVQDLSISGDRVHVGSRITQTSSFPGMVDDAVIYSVQLTDAEIAWIAGRTAPIYKPF